MSLFSSIGKALRIGAGAVLSSVPVIGPSLGAHVAQSAIPRTARLPAVPAALPGAGYAGFTGSGVPQPLSLTPSRLGFPPGGMPTTRAGFDLGVPGPGVFSPTQPPPGYHLSKRPPYHFVKNRRMNPMNPKAARRAIRRIKSARKMLQSIEKSLPKQRTTRRSYGPRHITGPRHTS